ncbi:hypothetical protein GCM10008967_37290 [Bacillus carboniphilus]|uniref:DUF3139 domain-containing protein n=1 Tax=Bacillus carboniphilus TaxID=86663 RepID=A0ABP3GE73_9BACI
MHPITVIEIMISTIFVAGLFIIAFLLPYRMRKKSIITVSFITLLLLLFFAVRPFWIDYQVSLKTEKLNQYLEENYPGEVWEIRRQVGRQYNPYHLKVTFENEKDWTYTYYVGDDQICQTVWSPPDGMGPIDGKHFEYSGCK